MPIRGNTPGVTPATLSFTIVATDLGTSPTATGPDDTLTITSTDNSIDVTGNSTTDTVDLTVAAPFHVAVNKSQSIAANTSVEVTATLSESYAKFGLVNIQSQHAVASKEARKGLWVMVRPSDGQGHIAAIFGDGAYSGTFNTLNTANQLSEPVFDTTGNNIYLEDIHLDGSDLNMDFKNDHATLSRTLDVDIVGWFWV